MMSDAEYLAEIKARRELEAMGYSLKLCPKCKGTGLEYPDRPTLGLCIHCGGRGKVWNQPPKPLPPPQPTFPTCMFPKCKERATWEEAQDRKPIEGGSKYCTNHVKMVGTFDSFVPITPKPRD